MTPVFNDSVTAEIRRLLSESRRSQRDLCAALGWDKSRLSRRLAGHVEFSLGEIEEIASALDVSRSQLIQAPIRKASSE